MKPVAEGARKPVDVREILESCVQFVAAPAANSEGVSCNTEILRFGFFWDDNFLVVPATLRRKTGEFHVAPRAGLLPRKAYGFCENFRFCTTKFALLVVLGENDRVQKRLAHPTLVVRDCNVLRDGWRTMLLPVALVNPGGVQSKLGPIRVHQTSKDHSASSMSF